MLPGAQYCQPFRDQEHYDISMQHTTNGYLRMDGSEDLSTRCSIDYCEAHAIHTVIRRLFEWIQEQTQHCQYSWQCNDIMKKEFGIRSARILTDSQTVLKWLDGTYQAKNKNMK